MAAARKRSSPADPLAPYRGKRDFARTPEPAGRPGGSPAGPGRRFVVQRHRASRLHYDFRLEVDGVLVSWAVPKGPTLDAGVRRGAFHVEDHPLEYIDFEGVIPRGEYGGGDVIVWDAGTWEPYDAGDPPDPGRALAGGELHVDMHGEKLRGRFVIVRTRVDASGRETWLLLHKHDEYAVDGWDAEDHPRSVLTGRTNDEVKADPDRMWRSDLPAARAAVPLKAPRTAPVSAAELAELDGFAGRGTWTVFGRQVRVSDLDRVVGDPRPGEAPVTKRDLLRYAAQVAPTVLPYLTGRALVSRRLPTDGWGLGPWQRQLPRRVPDWLPRWDGTGPARTYLVVDEPAALVWAVNAGALEWHAWTSRTDQPLRPTYALIDLAPDGEWTDLLALARLHRDAFEHLGVRACPVLTGTGGIQIWVPTVPDLDFVATRAWVERLSDTIGAVAAEVLGPRRDGRKPIDAGANKVDPPPVAPYSPRPGPGVPVSTPVTWDELDDRALGPDGFTIHSVIDRLAARADPFQGLLDRPQRLPPLA